MTEQQQTLTDVPGVHLKGPEDYPDCPIPWCLPGTDEIGVFQSTCGETWAEGYVGRERERGESIKTEFRKICPDGRADLPIAHTLRFSCMHYHECKNHGRTAELSPRPGVPDPELRSCYGLSRGSSQRLNKRSSAGLDGGRA